MELPTVTVRQVLAQKGRTVHSIRPDASVYQALEHMANHRVGALLVMDGEQMVGIFSERDYARKVALQGHNSRTTAVGDMMSTRLHTAGEDTDLLVAMEAMTNNHFRHLPIVDNGRVVGIITIGDVVKAVIEAQQETISHLSGYIAGNLA